MQSNTLSLASARVHRDGCHMHGRVEPENTQHFRMRAQPINHPHLDCSQPPSAVTVVIRFNRAEMIEAKYLWWRTPLVLFSDHLIPTHSVRRTPCWLARARQGVLCAARDRSCSWDDLIHAQNSHCGIPLVKNTFGGFYFCHSSIFRIL